MNNKAALRISSNAANAKTAPAAPNERCSDVRFNMTAAMLCLVPLPGFNRLFGDTLFRVGIRVTDKIDVNFGDCNKYIITANV